MRTLTCTNCEKPTTTRWYSHTFMYENTKLSCLVPVRCCPICGEMFLDHVAETIIENAVAFHRNTL